MTVTRTGNTSNTAVVHYSSSDGTAKAGSDYTAASGDLTFNPGETNKNIAVTILDDSASEEDETFSATLNAVAGAPVGSPQTTTVTILDNEPLGTSPPARLFNISTRLRVDVGDKVMIGGFIITGNVSKPVVLRGIGPSLVNSNIPAASVLKDPVLELHGPNGSLITMNDNWKDSPQRAQIENTIFQPTDDREAVILATLPPGTYTAILAGKNGGLGIGLVEIYNLK